MEFTTTSTPKKPIITAHHLLIPTFSPKKRKAKIVTKKGLVIKSVYTSDIGSNINPTKKNNAVKTSYNPLI